MKPTAHCLPALAKLVLGSCLVMLLAGCESTPTIPLVTSSSSIPPSDPSDPCNREVQAFQGEANHFEKALGQAMGTAIQQGAVQMLQGLSMGDFSASRLNGSRLMNDMMSATLSGVTRGYLNSLAQSNDDTQYMLQRVNNDALADARRLDGVNGKIARLRDCRERQISRITSDYRQGKISAEQARGEFDQVQARVDRDNAFIGKLVNNSGARVATYQEASTFLATGTATRTLYAQKTGNVRVRASADSEKVGTISRGSPVEVIEQVPGNWYAIDYRGERRYLFASLLSSTPPATQARRSTAARRPAKSAKPQSGVERVARAQQTVVKNQQEFNEDLSNSIEEGKTVIG